MRFLRSRSWFALLGAGALACADAKSSRPVDPIGVEALIDHIEVLADDSMMGRGAGTSHELMSAQYVRDWFESIGLQPGVSGYLQSFEIGWAHSPDAGPNSQNVIAALPGRGDLADEWIILGAHYDHIGWRQVTPDSVLIFNGADDNASGTSLMMELARFLTAYFTSGDISSDDRRSIMFHAYGAEEVDLVGSGHFCQLPTVPMSSIAAMVNLDMIGRLQLNGLTAIGTSSAAFWESLIADVNVDSLPVHYDDKYLRGSDQKCFYDAGRPVLFFFTGLHDQYHQPEDDVWLVDGEGMVDVGELAARVLIELVTRPDL